MPESKNERNTRMLNHLHGHYVSSHVVWNMVRELRANQVLVDCNDWLVQPQRQHFMNELTYNDDDVWHVRVSEGVLICRYGYPEEELDAGFQRWQSCVKNARPQRQRVMSVKAVLADADAMLDDMTFDDMCAWACSRGIEVIDSTDRTAVQMNIVADVGVDSWAAHFGVVVA